MNGRWVDRRGDLLAGAVRIVVNRLKCPARADEFGVPWLGPIAAHIAAVRLKGAEFNIDRGGGRGLRGLLMTFGTRRVYIFGLLDDHQGESRPLFFPVAEEHAQEMKEEIHAALAELPLPLLTYGVLSAAGVLIPTANYDGSGLRQDPGEKST
jgi:hypothetical protein